MLVVWGLWDSPGESPLVEPSRRQPPHTHNGHPSDNRNLWVPGGDLGREESQERGKEENETFI